MISKLPRWVWSGAWVLAFVAGMVNVVGLLGFEQQAVSHLTGTTSLLAAALARLDSRAIFHLTAVLGSFIAGCILSGFVIQNSTLRLGRRYGVALFIESALLFVSVPLLKGGSTLGVYTASCACGLQNAMASTFSGAIVRTTHLSGMFTDFGIIVGQALRGLPADYRRILLCGVVVSGFFSGGVVGALAFARLGYATLLVPAGITAVVALAYGLFAVSRKRKARE